MEHVDRQKAEIRTRYEQLYAEGAKPTDAAPEGKTLAYRMRVQLVVAEAPPINAEQRRRLRPILAGTLRAVEARLAEAGQ